MRSYLMYQTLNIIFSVVNTIQLHRLRLVTRVPIAPWQMVSSTIPILQISETPTSPPPLPPYNLQPLYILSSRIKELSHPRLKNGNP